MDRLYTKNGRPLRVDGDKVFGPDGLQVGRIRRQRVHGPDGRYVGTIVGDRLVYRSTQASSLGSPFAPVCRAPTAAARRVGSAVWGEEPPI